MVGTAERLVEVWRGDICESEHRGHVAVWHADAGLIWALGDIDRPMLPRSSSKMIQALPLVESGAADAHGLTDAQLALACASHSGMPVHTGMVTDWLSALGLTEDALRCGAHLPYHEPTRDALVCSKCAAGQRHNNCSGKHSGFLTLTKHLKAGPEYVDPAHPVQRAVLAAWEELTDETSPGYGIDGCSAPNFASSLKGFARALSQFAAARDGADARQSAMVRLRGAMMAHPLLVAGEGRACTRLMEVMGPRAAIKTGAEAVFAAIVPEHRIGVAVKIADGATRASEAVVTEILCKLGLLDRADPVAQGYLSGPIRNVRGTVTGGYRLTEALTGWQPRL
ncbi:asparaginase [Roseicyclus persicicus]|uniref:Asparaginase n=1 Tax=Roseicyclus persicicus TaxID=2650661 RepID=A0A7X6GZA6_9RHOB|nr:asparaginase [Roseibacterium persicicum]NKX45156.1 asparaginase [Roseibacterium persicicum]